MKIIAFGDIHMAATEVGKIPGVEEADLLLLNGDLTNFGGRREIRSVLDDVMEINPRVLAQFGNLDYPEINDYLEDLDLNLHGQARLVRGQVCLLGIGGSNYTPFHTPSEFSEVEIREIGDKAFRQGLEYTALARPLNSKNIPLILISHAPPYNTRVDQLRDGKHVGSKAVRALIEKYQPDLCIAGHIHEAKGSDTIVDTPVYNPGMLRQGGYVTVHIHQTQLEITLQ